ncbi:nuclear transport factor 2 family protein [Roseivirga sp.]|uniref:nuclear transport factor 2 family protein n=1 Tax=Roseivirga sp. TaxID=1964215 RepID=UPI003B8DEFFD
MKRNQLKILAIVLVAATSLAFTLKPVEDAAAKEEIQELILKSYVNGAFNGLDADAMRKGFHEDFAIYSPKGEAISKYPIKVWADGVAKRKANNYNAADPKNKWDHNFASVDVTGNAAQVKIELHNQGKHVYTDYLSLLKFESGWRIVAKVYHQH